MADYYPLVARAVAGLEKNTGDARRALYERARTALVAQLRGVQPALGESEITRERLALEEAIRKVEIDAARRGREQGTAQAVPPRPASPRPAGARPAPAGAPQPASAAAQVAKPHHTSVPSLGHHDPAPRPAAQPSLAAEGLRGFRESVGLPEHGEPPPPPPKPFVAPIPAPAPPPPPPPAPQTRMPPHDPLAGLPTAHDFDQLEPPIDQHDLHHQPYPPMDDFSRPVDYDSEGPLSRDLPPDDEPLPPPRRSFAFPIGAIVKIAISTVIVFSLLGAAYWQRGTIMGLYRAFRGQPAQVARDTSQSKSKISDRIGLPGTATQQQPGGAVPAVAQRVVLYEEEANDPQGKRYIGSVIWKTETVSPGAGKPPDVGIRADVEIPERRLTMTFTIRRNADQTLPASHTAEIMFNLPADFAPGGISNVPGILMKQAEQTRGVPLAGLAVKVTTGYFLVGLSAVEADRQRNIELLKERAWFDIPIVYNNNRRAILALEKGTPGERVFAEAFAAWKQ